MQLLNMKSITATQARKLLATRAATELILLIS